MPPQNSNAPLYSLCKREPLPFIETHTIPNATTAITSTILRSTSKEEGSQKERQGWRGEQTDGRTDGQNKHRDIVESCCLNKQPYCLLSLVCSSSEGPLPIALLLL